MGVLGIQVEVVRMVEEVLVPQEGVGKRAYAVQVPLVLVVQQESVH